MISPLAGLRVLVVDDERGIATQVVRQLERAGAACVAAYSGREGLDQLAEGAFDRLAEGQRVSFDEEPSPKGPRAGNVRAEG